MNHLKKIAKDMTALTPILRARCPHFLAYSFMLMITLGAQWGSKAMELDAFTADSGFESFQGLPSATQYALFEDDTRAAAPSAPYIPHASTAYSFFPADLDLPPDNFATNFATFDIDDFLAQATVITQLPDYGSQPENPSTEPIPSIEPSQALMNPAVEEVATKSAEKLLQRGKRKRHSQDTPRNTRATRHSCPNCGLLLESERELKIHISIHKKVLSKCPAEEECPYEGHTVYMWKKHFRDMHPEIRHQLENNKISLNELGLQIYEHALHAQTFGGSSSFADKLSALLLKATQSQPTDTDSDRAMNLPAPSDDPQAGDADELDENVSHIEKYPSAFEDTLAPGNFHQGSAAAQQVEPENPSAESLQSIEPSQALMNPEMSEVATKSAEKLLQRGKRKRQSQDTARNTRATRHSCPNCGLLLESERELNIHISIHKKVLSKCPINNCSDSYDTVSTWTNHLSNKKHKDINAQLKGKISKTELAFCIYKKALNALELGGSSSFADELKALLETQSTKTKSLTCSHPDCSSRPPYKKHSDFIRHQSTHNPVRDTCPLPPCKYKGATIPAWNLHFATAAHKKALTGVNIFQLAQDTYYAALKAQKAGELLSTEEPTELPLAITQSSEHIDSESDRTMNHHAPADILSAEYTDEMSPSLTGLIEDYSSEFGQKLPWEID